MFSLHGLMYRCDAFAAFPWQTHAFGTRAASPEASVTLKQIHSSRVWKADGLGDRAEQGDGLVTDQLGLSIGIRTADCVPILLLDRRIRAVAALHAGWRGTADRIAARALARMAADYATDTRDVFAAIGPCIQACCYRVGADVAAHFTTWKAVVANDHVDLAAANRAQLLEAGVPALQIFNSGMCTACFPDVLYSYRRDPENPGRMLASICRIL